MRLDIGKPHLDLCDLGGIARNFGTRHQAGALGVGGQHRVEQALVRRGRFLRHAADPGAGRDLDLSRIERKLTANQPKKGRLAGAVAPDEANLVPGRDHGRGVLEETLAFQCESDIPECQHEADLACAMRLVNNSPPVARRAAADSPFPGLRPRATCPPEQQGTLHLMAIQKTFSIIKPDATRRNLTGAINAKLEAAGLRIIAQKRIHLSLAQAEAFYAVHKERPFFAELTKFMSSEPIVAQVLEGEDAIAKNREVMGATNPADAADGTIRKEFALSIGENSIHGSDGPDTAATEIAYFFSGLELVG